MQALQNDINDLKNIAEKDIHLLKDRHCDLKQLTTATENLCDTTKIFHRVTEKNKWRIWRENNLKRIKMAFILIINGSKIT
jgi:hypothetical protein